LQEWAAAEEEAAAVANVALDVTLANELAALPEPRSRTKAKKTNILDLYCTPLGLETFRKVELFRAREENRENERTRERENCG
jgi:hypothetical protein